MKTVSIALIIAGLVAMDYGYAEVQTYKLFDEAYHVSRTFPLTWAGNINWPFAGGLAATVSGVLLFFINIVFIDNK